MSGPAEPGRKAPADLRGLYRVIHRSYDRMNRLMSLGLDMRWRRVAAREAGAAGPVLDLCAGTGDMTLACARSGAAPVVSCDFSPDMLSLAKDKLARERVPFFPVLGDAAALPFADNAFPALVSAFGIRNLTYKNERGALHLAEMFRVIAPGGRLVALETAPPGRGPLGLAVRLYVRAVTALAGAFSGARGEYAYLGRSSLEFYTNGELDRMFNDAGFSETRHVRLLAGAAAVHVAVKPR